MYTKCENAKITGTCSTWFECGRLEQPLPRFNSRQHRKTPFVPKHEKNQDMFTRVSKENFGSWGAKKPSEVSQQKMWETTKGTRT